MSFFGNLIGAIAAPFTGGASLIGTLASGASTVAGMLGGGSKGGGLSQIGSLAGSLIDRNAARNDRDYQNWYNDPLQQRVRAERAGINPLAYISNVPSAAMGAGGMAVGQALADASLVLGDTLEKRDLARSKTTQLEQQNEELRKRETQRVLRPDVGGIFGGGDVPHVSQIPTIGGLVPGTGRDGKEILPEERYVTETFHNDGQSTDVPLGPDFDEIISGALIDSYNKSKAEKAAREAYRQRKDITFGEPLSVPRGAFFMRDYKRVLPPPYDTPRSIRRSPHALKSLGF